MNQSCQKRNKTSKQNGFNYNHDNHMKDKITTQKDKCKWSIKYTNPVYWHS